MARPVRSGDCVSRFMCRSFGRRIPEYVYVEPTRPGGRRDPDLNAQPYGPLSHYVTIIITRRTPGGVAPRGPDPGRMRARRPRARPRRGRDVERSRRVLGVHAGDTLSRYTRARNRGVAIGHSAGTTSVITSVICY